jgi:hypothetical protein
MKDGSIIASPRTELNFSWAVSGPPVVIWFCWKFIYAYGLILLHDGVWFDHRIYWTLWYTAWLLHSFAHILVSTATFSLSLIGIGLQRRTFFFLWIPELSPNCRRVSVRASYTIFIKFLPKIYELREPRERPINRWLGDLDFHFAQQH